MTGPAEYRVMVDGLVKDMVRKMSLTRRLRDGHIEAIRAHLAAMIEGQGQAATAQFVAELAARFGVHNGERWDGVGNPPGWREGDPWRFDEHGDGWCIEAFQRRR